MLSAKQIREAAETKYALPPGAGEASPDQSAEQIAKLAQEKYGNLPSFMTSPGVEEEAGIVASALDMVPSPIIRVLDYVNRPYSAITGGIVGLEKGENPLPYLQRGFMGEEDFSGYDVLTNMGADPEGRTAYWGGLVWDLTLGTVYDPVSWLTLGTSKAGQALQKTHKAATGGKKLSRSVLAAKRGWAPVNLMGKPVVPKGVSVGTARAFDATLGKIPDTRVIQSIRKMVGGKRYWDEKNYPKLARFLKERSYEWQKEGQDTAAFFAQLQKAYPEDARRMMSYLYEDPRFGKGSPVRIRVPKSPTLQDVQDYAEQVRPYLEASVNATEGHRGRFMLELDQLGKAVDNMADEASRTSYIKASDIGDALFTSIPDQQGILTEDLLTRMMNEDYGFDAEELIRTVLVDSGSIQESQRDAVQLLGVLSKPEWDQLYKQYGDKQNLLFLKAKKLWEKRKKGGAPGETFRYGMESVRDAGGDAVFIYQNPGLTRISSDLHGLGGISRPLEKRKETAKNMLQAFSRYAEQGGDTLELTSNWADSINTQLSGAARKKAEEAWKGEVRKMTYETAEGQVKRLSPDTKTVQSMLGSVHDRIWTSMYTPGDYTHNLDELARMGMEEVVEDPAQRYVITQKRIRDEMNEAVQELDTINQGKWDPPAWVRPEWDDLDDQARAAEATRVVQAGRKRLDEVRQQVFEKRQQIDNSFDFGTGKETLTDTEKTRLFEEIQALRDEEFDLMSTLGNDAELADLRGPIHELEQERAIQLQQRLDELNAQLYNPDPFDKAQYVRKLMDEKGQKVRFQRPVEERIVDAGSVATPEVYEGIDQARPIIRDSEERFLKRLKDYDPSLERLPISQYLPHQMRRSRGIIPVKKLDKTKHLMDKYRADRWDYYLNKRGWVDTSAVESAVARDTIETFGHDPDVWRLGKGKSDLFKHRKYPFTLYELRKSDLGMNFHEDFPYLVNKAIKTREDWIFGDDLYRFATENYGVPREQLNPDQLKKFRPVDWHIPFIDPDKNPYKNIYIPKEAEEMVQRVFKARRRMTTDEGVQSFLDTLHSIRRHWAAWTLTPFPAYDTRNAVSDMMRAGMEDLHPWTKRGRESYATALDVLGHTAHWPKWDVLGHRAGRLVKENPKSLDRFLDAVNQRWPDAKVDREAFLDIMRRDGILEGWVRNLDTSFLQDTDLLKYQRGRLKKILSKTPLSAFMHTNESEFLEVMGRKSQMVNDFTKIALWADVAKRNMDIPGFTWQNAVDDATATVRKALFDYSDLTEFERQYVKLVYPFYTFTAKNIPYQFEKLITEPKRFAYLSRLYNGAWNAYEDELEPGDVPDWLGENLGIPVGRLVNKETGEERHVLFNPQGWVAQSAVNETVDLFRSMDSLRQFFISQANPAFKEPIEQMFNQDAFTGRAIREGRIRDVMGIPMPDWAAHIVRNIRLFTELDRMNPTFGGLFPDGVWTHTGRKLGAWEEKRPHRREAPAFWRATQFATGVKTYGVDAQNEQRREMKRNQRKIRDLAYDIAWAEREGQTLEARRLRREQEKAQEALRVASERYTDISRRRAAEMTRHQEEYKHAGEGDK